MRKLQIAITQSNFDRFKSQLGQTLAARISGGVVLGSRLGRVDPRATKRAPHESLYASLGGPLESRAVKGDGQQPGDFELLSPHFTGFAALTPEQSKSLRAGQRGVVWLGRREQTIGGYLQNKLQTMLPENLK